MLCIKCAEKTQLLAFAFATHRYDGCKTGSGSNTVVSSLDIQITIVWVSTNCPELRKSYKKSVLCNRNQI